MVSNVRVLPMLGPSCSDSEVVENAVLLETPLPLPCPRPSPTNFPGAHRPHPAAEKRARGDAAKSAAAGATAKGRGWAALDQPVSVALFEGSLQMETRDPFGPDPDSGLRAHFSSGERKQKRDKILRYGRGVEFSKLSEPPRLRSTLHTPCLSPQNPQETVGFYFQQKRSGFCRWCVTKQKKTCNAEGTKIPGRLSPSVEQRSVRQYLPNKEKKTVLYLEVCPYRK